MGNYDRMLEFGRRLFLQWDQDAMIHRCALRADENYLYLRDLGQPHRVSRATGAVENCALGRAAEPTQALTIYDYLCRAEPLPVMCGRRCAANALRHVAQSSPDTVALHRRWAERFQARLPALREALRQMEFAPFPQGDAACVFPVFDGFTAVFQFWEGDEEFPPSVRFLWDENTPDYLKYETLYYVMGDFLARLDAHIREIGKKLLNK